MAWRDLRILQRLGLRVPLFQSPMAGAQASDLAIAVARGGGLGAIPCALLSPDAVREHVQLFRAATKDLSSPINLNFFCHTLPPANPMADKQWQDILTPYYREYGVDLAHLTTNGALRMPFDEVSLDLVRELKPEVVSFHFGLPSPHMLQGVKDAGAFVISSATTVREALWLEEQGCDAVIAQGLEAGGGETVSDNYRNSSMDFPRQTGTMSLVPQIVDAVKIPVIAAGGIGDARGVFAASALGAAAVQMGTVFLLADETKTSALHRKMLKRAASATGEEALETAITTIFSGRPARGFVTRVMRELGPMSAAAPEFPTAGAPLGALKQAAEANGDTAFSSLWSGQSPGFAQEKSAEIIVRSIVEELEVLEADNANGTLSSL
ncbi:Aldolase-type TIM barrel [Phytophthora cactorum]|nr:Aldolase-type TIM barrel [Phytophthora cactorum]KAF1779749.1 Aldolase-type TIM barrel [Phytophthora cactorum]